MNGTGVVIVGDEGDEGITEDDKRRVKVQKWRRIGIKGKIKKKEKQVERNQQETNNEHDETDPLPPLLP